MTTANTYIASAATIAGSSKAGLTTFTVRASGTKANLRSDGEIYHKQNPIVEIVETIDCECRDMSSLPAVGAIGQCVFAGVKPVGTEQTGASISCTAAKAVVESVESTLDLSGQPVVRITLAVNSSTGSATGIAWASA